MSWLTENQNMDDFNNKVSILSLLSGQLQTAAPSNLILEKIPEWKPPKYSNVHIDAEAKHLGEKFGIDSNELLIALDTFLTKPTPALERQFKKFLLLAKINASEEIAAWHTRCNKEKAAHTAREEKIKNLNSVKANELMRWTNNQKQLQASIKQVWLEIIEDLVATIGKSPLTVAQSRILSILRLKSIHFQTWKNLDAVIIAEIAKLVGTPSSSVNLESDPNLRKFL